VYRRPTCPGERTIDDEPAGPEPEGSVGGVLGGGGGSTGVPIVDGGGGGGGSCEGVEVDAEPGAAGAGLDGCPPQVRIGCARAACASASAAASAVNARRRARIERF